MCRWPLAPIELMYVAEFGLSGACEMSWLSELLAGLLLGLLMMLPIVAWCGFWGFLGFYIAKQKGREPGEGAALAEPRRQIVASCITSVSSACESSTAVGTVARLEQRSKVSFNSRRMRR